MFKAKAKAYKVNSWESLDLGEVYASVEKIMATRCICAKEQCNAKDAASSLAMWVAMTIYIIINHV